MRALKASVLGLALTASLSIGGVSGAAAAPSVPAYDYCDNFVVYYRNYCVMQWQADGYASVGDCMNSTYGAGPCSYRWSATTPAGSYEPVAAPVCRWEIPQIVYSMCP